MTSVNPLNQTLTPQFQVLLKQLGLSLDQQTSEYAELIKKLKALSPIKPNLLELFEAELSDFASLSLADLKKRLALLIEKIEEDKVESFWDRYWTKMIQKSEDEETRGMEELLEKAANWFKEKMKEAGELFFMGEGLNPEGEIKPEDFAKYLLSYSSELALAEGAFFAFEIGGLEHVVSVDFVPAETGKTSQVKALKLDLDLEKFHRIVSRKDQIRYGEHVADVIATALENPARVLEYKEARRQGRFLAPMAPKPGARHRLPELVNNHVGERGAEALPVVPSTLIALALLHDLTRNMELNHLLQQAHPSRMDPMLSDLALAFKKASHLSGPHIPRGYEARGINRF